MAVLLLGLLTVGAGYSAVMPSSADAQSAAQSQQIEAGRRLFVVSCSSCHGMNGEGGSNGDAKHNYVGPSLIGVGSAAVDFQVGTGRMPAMQVGAQMPRKKPIFDSNQIAALAAYVNSLGTGSQIPDASAYDISKLSDADITRGGILFRTNCTACHNFAGRGGALPRGKYAPTLMGVPAKYIYEAMLTGPQQMPVFSDQVMTPQDKRDIIGYIKAMQNTGDPGGFSLGRLGPTSEGLTGWVFGLGTLVGVACWIAYKGARVPKKRFSNLAAAAHGVDSGSGTPHTSGSTAHGRTHDTAHNSAKDDA